MNQTLAAGFKKNSAGAIAAFLQCTNLGGMEQVAYALFDRLGSRGFKVKVVTPRPWGLGESRVRQADPEALAFNYRGKFGWRSFGSFNRQARTLGNGANRVWVIGTCVSCLAAARLTGRKVLLSHHYHHFDNATSRLRWSAFYLAFGAGLDAITYPTEFTRNEALKIAPWLQGKTHVVRNGFDIHYTTEERRLADKRAARAELKIPQDAWVVGNGGWLIQRKRFDVFLQTAQRVIRQLPNSRFYICGGGPEEPRLRQLASELGIANQVHFLGWVQNMDAYYRAWDVLLFNTDFDALGCTPLEAAAHGCLGVASCVHGGLHEFLQDGQTGFILNQHDPEKLAAGIVRLAHEPGLALAMRQRAIQKLEQEFSHQQALDFYEHYFRPAGANGISA